MSRSLSRRSGLLQPLVLGGVPLDVGGVLAAQRCNVCFKLGRPSRAVPLELGAPARRLGCVGFGLLELAGEA